MCGRFVMGRPARDLKAALQVDDWADEAAWQPSFNLAPTRQAPVLLGTAGHFLRLLRWGLVPHWARDATGASKLINARSETLPEKAAFRDLLAARRCIIPVDGYYEWQQDGTRKQPFYLHRPDNEVLLLAGLWDTWRAPDQSVWVTFTIITTEASPALASIHHRMPAIMDTTTASAWLAIAETPPTAACAALRPWEGSLLARPVDPRVGSVKHDDPQLIEPYGGDLLSGA
jgi:putative SOS response-associated peptidase YedK